MKMRVENRMNRVADKVALASGMALVVLSGSSVAEAGIVASQGLPLRPPATQFGQVGWDVDGDGSADFVLRNGVSGRTVPSLPTYYGNTFPYFVLYPAAFLSRGPGGEIVGSSLGKLPAGAVVGPDANFGVQYTQMLTVSGQIAVGGWQMGETGFFGFKFGSGPTLYGWAELAFDPTSANTAGYGYQILRAYYDDTGAPITVGNTGTGGSPVPEPSSYALALLAAGGVAAYRSRRKTVAA
jgi:hypothetical protein